MPNPPEPPSNSPAPADDGSALRDRVQGLERPDAADSDAGSRDSAAGLVAAGIFSSRVLGLLRERAVAYFFGVSAHADVWQVAFKSPNLLQNLLGEGTISAAFIPIYSRLVEAGRAEDAGRFAGAIFGLLLAVAGGLALLGIALAGPIVTVLAPGFLGEAAGGASVDRFGLAVQAVRIVFPMAGVLVLSAWALGVLNSHRRFFVPYVAPALWNVAIIAFLFGGAYWATGTPWAPDGLGAAPLTDVLVAGCVGAFVGGVVQFGVQLPFVVRVMPGFNMSVSTRATGVRQALGAFGPVVAGRGVAQLSSYLDLFLASWLAVGALGALRYAQLLYMLPISLFGMSVAASELPELSRLTAAQARGVTARLHRSLRQIAFLTVPTVVGYLAFGPLLVGALFQTGEFRSGDTWLVTLVLGGYALGILATTMSRLLQNAFYATGDTETPAWIAVTRVTVSTAVAVPAMFGLDRVALGRVVGSGAEDPLFLGAVGLSLGASVGAWVELWRLVRALRPALPQLRVPWRAAGRMMGLAVAAVPPAAGLWWVLPAWDVLLVAPLVVGTYAAVYLGVAVGVDLNEVQVWTRRFLRWTDSAPDA